MRRHYSAFTLIELVIASALAALLMVGVMMVLTGIIRDRKRLSAAPSSEPASPAALAEILRRDLSCSTQFSVLADGSIQINGLSALDDKTLQSIDRPSLITYRLSDRDGLRMLIRDEAMQDEPVQPHSLRTLLATHVSEFKIDRLHDKTDRQTDATDQSIGDSADEKGIPNRVRLRIAFDDSPDVINQVLCLR
jgi:type II secretory pathway pseudopilin PulG